MSLPRRALLRGAAAFASAFAAAPFASLVSGCSRPKSKPGVAPAPAAALGSRESSALCGSRLVGNPQMPAARPGLRAETLARFVDALPVPAVLHPTELRVDPLRPNERIPYYRIVMQAATAKLHRDLPPTQLFTYAGSFPGPTIAAERNRPLLIEWLNALPTQHLLPIDHSLHGAHADQPEVRAITHVHGARVPPESDGFPENWLVPGKSAVFRYPNQQDAATLWYHDHAMGIERLNHYAGMFGLFLIRDELETRLSLPSGAYELPLILCDRAFDQAGQLQYPVSGMPDSAWVPEVYGDAMLVNGKVCPFLEVEPRAYRFRVVNASNGRFFYLSLGNKKRFALIGVDQGFLAAPVTLDALTLAPAERADLVIDFADVAGQKLVLQSLAFPLMEFRVASGPTVKPRPLPTRLRAIPKPLPAHAEKTRILTLNQYEDPRTHRMLMLLNGSYFRDPVTEIARLGSTEIWSLLNLTEDTHPIHLHLVRFQLLDRRRFDVDTYLGSGSLEWLSEPQPPPPDEAGWKDTVRAESGMVTRILVRFDSFAGRYVWHCHVLEHAANEMMRPFDVVTG